MTDQSVIITKSGERRSAQPMRQLTSSNRFIRWLKSLWGLNLLLGTISIGTIYCFGNSPQRWGFPGSRMYPRLQQ